MSTQLTGVTHEQVTSLVVFLRAPHGVDNSTQGGEQRALLR